MKKKTVFMLPVILLCLVFSHQGAYCEAHSVQELVIHFAESLNQSDTFEIAKHLFINPEDAKEIEKRVKSITYITENYKSYYEEKHGRPYKPAAKDMILEIIKYHVMTIGNSQKAPYTLLFYYFPKDVEGKTMAHEELNLSGDPKLGTYRKVPPALEKRWNDLITQYKMNTENELVELKESRIIKSEPLTVETRGFADKKRNYNGIQKFKINGVEAFLASVKFNINPSYGLTFTIMGLKIDNKYVLCEVPAIETWGKKQ